MSDSDWEPDFEALEARDAENDSRDGEAEAEEAEQRRLQAAEAPERFRIEPQAAWAMEKLAHFTRRQEENKAVAQDRIQAVNEWLKAENNKLQPDVDFFTAILLEWHMSLIGADPEDETAWKKQQDKTITLPDGVLKVNKGRYSTTIEDEEAFIKWWDDQTLEVQSALAEPKIEPKKGAIGEYIAETAESIPGVKYERGETTFTVKPKVGE